MQSQYSLFLIAVLAVATVGCTQTRPAAPPTNSQPTFHRAEQIIESSIAAGKCPGAVLLIGRGDQVIYKKAFGSKSLRPTTQPMQVDTVFDAASLTKPVATATSIMILRQRGRLKLDDPVAKYLPAFAANGKEHVTIEDLLLHVSGLIADNDLADYDHGPAEAMKKIFALPLERPLRSRFVYSDVGYIVLAEVVKAVDGRRLDLFASEEIFRPLGMTDSGFLPGPAIRARCAITGQRDGHWMQGEVHDPRAYALGGVAGDAGLFCTADDLSRFCRMILNSGMVDGSRILSPETVADMTRPRPVTGDKPGKRALGLDIDTGYSSVRGDRFPRGASFGHTGFTGVAFWIDPVDHCYFVLMTNAVHPDGKGSAKQLRHDVATAVGEVLLGAATTRP